MDKYFAALLTDAWRVEYAVYILMSIPATVMNSIVHRRNVALEAGLMGERVVNNSWVYFHRMI